MLGRLQWLGTKIFDGIEKVGEAVVSVLGLDDSRYQDVLETMTPREMQAAERVHMEREEEYRVLNEQRSPEVAIETGGVTGTAVGAPDVVLEMTGTAPCSPLPVSVVSEEIQQAVSTQPSASVPQDGAQAAAEEMV